MHEAALVRERHVAACEHVGGDRLAEDFDAQGVGDDLFGLALEIRVHEGDVVVGADDVAQRGQSLFDALDLNRIRQRVAQVLQFLVGRRRGHQQAVLVAGRQAADDARAGDGAVGDGDEVGQLGFEDGVEILRGADGDEAVGVGQVGEDADLVGVFKLLVGVVLVEVAVGVKQGGAYLCSHRHDCCFQEYGRVYI